MTDRENYKNNPKGVLLWSLRRIYSMQWAGGSNRRGAVGKIVITVPYELYGPELPPEEKRERLQCAAAWHLRDKMGGLDHSSIRIKLDPFDSISITITTFNVEDYNLFTPQLTNNKLL